MDDDGGFQLNLDFIDGPHKRKLSWKERKSQQVGANSAAGAATQQHWLDGGMLPDLLAVPRT